MENSSGGGAATAQLLADRGVRAIIVRTEMSHAAREQLDEAGVAALDAGRFAIRVEGGVAVTDRARFEEAYAAWAARRHGAQTSAGALARGAYDTYRYNAQGAHR
jgi:predicted RNase H-like nuclease (RuvC/YqgF family)